MAITVQKNQWLSIILILLFPALFLLSIFKLIDTDIWFHMKAGQVMTETGSFLYSDIFSYTAEGREWLYHEWLFGIISYKIYSLFGVNGLVIGKAALLTLAFFIIYRIMRLREVDPRLASFILVIGVLAGRFRFTERPHIFKFLFVPLFIYLLELFRYRKKNILYLLPVLQVLWTNIHGSFILGPAIIGIYLFSEALVGRRDGLRALVIVFVSTILATLINPYGLKLLAFSIGFGEKAVLASISEWSPTGLADFYSAFGLLFMAALLTLILKYRKADAVDILTFLLFAYLSLKAVRFKALFSLAAAPLLSANLNYLFGGLKDRRASRYISAVFIGIIALLAGHELSRDRMIEFGLGEGRAFPRQAVGFLKENPISGNLYNSYAFGGFLIWGLYPEKKVFVDGRAEVFDREFQDAFISVASADKWFEAVRIYDITHAVIAYSKGGLDPIGDWIAGSREWVLIYWDDAARIYARKVPSNGQIIERFGHLIMRDPMAFDYTSLKSSVVSGSGGILENELNRDIIANGRNTRAMYWLGMLYYETGRKDDAMAVWKRAVDIFPDADLHMGIGNLHIEKGQPLQAVEHYKAAIKKGSFPVEVYFNLGMAYEAVNKKGEAVKAYEKFIRDASAGHADEVKEAESRVRRLIGE